MKKIILFLGICLLTLGLSAQTTMRKGIEVGLSPYGDRVLVDSIISTTGLNIQFYSGGVALTPSVGGMVYPGAGIAVSTGIAWGASVADASANWNTAYTDRLKWDGGATGLTAATGRTSLGATTVGAAFFMLTNPSAITFVRINADNSISALSAANFKTALSLSSTDVGLNNLTNKAQVELEDSVNYPNGYMTRYDGITGLASKVNFSDSSTVFVTPYDLILENFVVPGDSDVIFATPYDLLAAALSYVALSDSGTAYITPTDLAEAIAPFEDTVALETIVTLQADTVPLFVFGGGGGNAGDTTMLTTSTIYGSYRVIDTTIITSINAVMVAGTTPLGTDTLGIQIYFNDSINVTTGGSVRLLNSATLGINSVTTGTVDASFANNTIYPGERVFMKSPGVVTGRKPIYVEVTVYGHIVNRAY